MNPIGGTSVNASAKNETSREKPMARPIRCHCGSLLARLVPDGVEIKCRRCKRRVVIPLSVSTAKG
jgi:hypothetical protein